jgi:hypothetical protein
MSEQLNEALTRWLDYLEKGEGLVIDKAPVIMEQVLTYNFWGSLLLFSIFSLISALIVAFGVFLFVSKKEEWDRVPATVFSQCAHMISFPVMALSTDWLKILIAPDLYLLDYIRGMM